MKNGNFINDFLLKACSIIVSKVKSQSMAGRGDFSKMWFFFPQGILTFFYACFYAGGKMLIFLDVIFFGFARGCFKKQQKNKKKKNQYPLRKKNTFLKNLPYQPYFAISPYFFYRRFPIDNPFFTFLRQNVSCSLTVFSKKKKINLYLWSKKKRYAHSKVKEFSIQPPPLGFSKNLKICHFLSFQSCSPTTIRTCSKFD